MADPLKDIKLTVFDGYVIALYDAGQCYADLLEWFTSARFEMKRNGGNYPDSILEAVNSGIDPKLADKYNRWQDARQRAWNFHAKIVLETNPALVFFTESETKLREAEAIMPKSSKAKKKNVSSNEAL